MAPEHFLRPRCIDARADLYALGCLLYRLLTGSHPIQGCSISEISRKIVEGDYLPVRALRPDVPLKFERIVQRAMEREPEDRYQTASEMGEALRAAASSPRKLVSGILIAVIAALLAVIGILLSWF